MHVTQDCILARETGRVRKRKRTKTTSERTEEGQSMKERRESGTVLEKEGQQRENKQIETEKREK